MSARLSRRFGRVASLSTMKRLAPAQFMELNRLTEHLDAEFDDLPEPYQRIIEEAERECWGDQAEAIVATYFGPTTLSQVSPSPQSEGSSAAPSRQAVA